MSFIAVAKKTGIVIEGDGILNVLNGKCRKTSKVLKKDTEPVEGIEFILSIAQGSNIKFEKWIRENDRPKKVDDLDPKEYPMTVTIFLPKTETVGQAYLNIFDNLKALELPENLADGFSGLLGIEGSKCALAFAQGDYSKADVYLPMLFEDAKSVPCSLSFPEGGATSNFGGSKGQSLLDKAQDRLKLCEQFRTSDSPVQKEFVALSTFAPDMTAIQFLMMLTQ